VSILPVKLEDLITAKTVESVRLDFKATWDANIRDSTTRTICAFANDFQGLNGGYVVIGIEDLEGEPVFPPRGLDEQNIELIQTEIRGACNRIEPTYQPLLSPETYMGRQILVVYAPMGDARPYQAPERSAGASPKHYYVRIGPSTVEPDAHVRTQLLQVTARVPFDERRRPDVGLAELSPRLVLKFFEDVGSDLSHAHRDSDVNPIDTLRRLRLLGGVNGSEAPRNVALLFFTELPENHFPTAKIEIAQFRDDTGGELLETRSFGGPLSQQITDTMTYLETVFGTVIAKNTGSARARRVVAYPVDALREAVVNAVFHRGYEGALSPARIALYPDRLEITSYPGPVPGVELSHMTPGAKPPLVPPRNPRVGELLKALRLAETWHTGVPRIHRTMKDNGSPAPNFEFDTDRTYFRVTLPAHPGYVALNALREAAVLWHTGDRERGIEFLRSTLARVPQSGALGAQLIEYLAATRDLGSARGVLTALEQTPGAYDRHLAYLALARAYLDERQTNDASALLANIPQPESPTVQSTLDLALLYKRSRSYQEAHRAFASVASSIQEDPKALHEFAQTKMQLARSTGRRAARAADVRRRLDREAKQLLERVIQLAADQPTRAAWAWFDLAKTRLQLGDPESVVVEAVDRAIRLLPEEARFRDWRGTLERDSSTRSGSGEPDDDD
jgi:ATP-dependent DNA helicase RecG